MEQITKDSILYIRHKKFFEKYGYTEKSVEAWIKTESILAVYNYISLIFIIIYLIYK